MKIDKKSLNRWKVVDRHSTALIANACCPRIDFRNSTKGDILKVFERGSFPSATVDVSKFSALMDAMAAYTVILDCQLKEYRESLLHPDEKGT